MGGSFSKHLNGLCTYLSIFITPGAKLRAPGLGLFYICRNDGVTIRSSRPEGF